MSYRMLQNCLITAAGFYMPLAVVFSANLLYIKSQDKAEFGFLLVATCCSYFVGLTRADAKHGIMVKTIKLSQKDYLDFN